MKILVIPTTDWTQHPVPNRLNHIFDRIADMGHEVNVLHFHYEKYERNVPRPTKCNPIYAGTATGDNISRFYMKYAGIHRGMIRTIVKDKKIDVVLSANIIPSRAAVGCGAPIVYDYLDVMDEAAAAYLTGIQKVIGKIAINRIMKGILHNADQIITVSPGLVGYLKTKYGIPHEHIPVIPNGVDLELFKPGDKQLARAVFYLNNNDPVIGYVGSVENWVDLETPIRAIKFQKANLVIIGPSLHTDERNRLMKIAEPYKDRVLFIGATPYDILPQYIAGFDVGINPLKPSAHNIYSAGGKIFNYMACGVPVVSTECDPGSMVKQHMRIYSSPDEYVGAVSCAMTTSEKEKEEARDVMKYYDWNVLAKKYEEVLINAAQ